MRKGLKKLYKTFKRKFYKPLIKGALMHLIVFYQKHFSHNTCLYQPTCSEYMKRSLNNKGVILGLLLGIWRLLRCNPFSKGGYDPEHERYFKLKWVL